MFGMTGTSRLHPEFCRQILNGICDIRFKMPSTRSCRCPPCRRLTTYRQGKRQKLFDPSELVCSARKGSAIAQQMKEDDSMDSYDPISDDDDASGDAYGCGLRTEETLNFAVTEAVKRFQHRELVSLIKNEYEFVRQSDSEEEFELV